MQRRARPLLPSQLRLHDEPSVCGARRLGPHAPLLHLMAHETNVMSLNGVDWWLAVRPSPDAVTEADICADAGAGEGDAAGDEGRFVRTRVPSNWQLEPAGHAAQDKPLYSNFTYACAPTPPLAHLSGAWREKVASDDNAGGGEPGGMLKAFVWSGEMPAAGEAPAAPLGAAATPAPMDEGQGSGQGLEAEEGARPHYAGGPNPTGIYRRSVALPLTWAEAEVGNDGCSEGTLRPAQAFTLTLHGADSCAYVYADGEFVGFGTDSRLPSEFDVTRQVRAAMADARRPIELAVVVPRLSAGTYFEDQDQWSLSGLHRGVTLTRVPERAIGDYSIVPRLEFEQQDDWGMDEAEPRLACAFFDIKVDVLAAHDGGATFDPAAQAWSPSAANDLALHVSVFDAQTSGMVTSTSGVAVDGMVRRGVATKSLTIDVPLERAQLWSADAPHLYRIVLTLEHTATGEAVSEEALVGLREVRIDKGVLRVNRRAVTIRGVNRHEHDPVGGKAVTYDSMLDDALLMKRANFNAVRCSHYPNSQQWYSICDKVGLYVIDEANIETHGFHDGGYPNSELTGDPQWAGALMERVMRMAERDKNHPCVIVWSLGNEAGFSSAHAAAAAWLRARDASRVVHYEGGLSRTCATDIICPMYRTADELMAWSDEEAVKPAEKRRPVIACEYSHAMGNSNGRLDEFWRAIWGRGNYLQGGFIWDWVDQGLLDVATTPENARRRRSSGHPSLRQYSQQDFLHGGHHDDMPHDAQFCLNGLLAPDRTPHPGLVEAAAVMQPVAFDFDAAANPPVLGVSNRLDHATLADVQLLVIARAMPCNAWEALATAAKVGNAPARHLKPLRCMLPVSGEHAGALASLSPGQRMRFPLREVFEWRAELERKAARLGGESGSGGGPPRWQLQVFALRGDVVLARDFFDVQPACAPLPPAPVRPLRRGGGYVCPVTLTRDTKNGEVRVVSEGFYEATVCLSTGALTRLASTPQVRGTFAEPPVELIHRAFDRPNVWRRPTDNDICPGSRSYAAQWKRHGLDRMEPSSFRADVDTQVRRGPRPARLWVGMWVGSTHTRVGRPLSSPHEVNACNERRANTATRVRVGPHGDM